MSTVQNLKIGSTTYDIQDSKALPVLTSAERTALLSTGTYRGEDIANNTNFMNADQKVEQYSYTLNTQVSSLSNKLAYSYIGPISYGNGKFLAIGTPDTSTNAKVYMSTDGSTWTNTGTLPVPYYRQFEYIAYGNGLYVTCARTNSGYSTNMYYSSDGVTWTSSGSSSRSGLAFGNNIFVAGTDGKTATFYTSTDGINWTERTLSRTKSWSTLRFVGSKFVALDASVIYSSTDGINWDYSNIDNYGWQGMCYDGSYYYVFSNTTNTDDAHRCYLKSSDGVTWTKVTMGATAPSKVQSAAYINGLYIIYSQTAGRLYYSTDTLNWTQVEGGDGAGTVTGFADNGSVICINNISNVYKASVTTTKINNLTPKSYNKSEVDTALATKQGTLTAGTGISIDSNNVISASSSSSYDQVTQEITL